jgi:hypothetical protein
MQLRASPSAKGHPTAFGPTIHECIAIKVHIFVDERPIFESQQGEYEERLEMIEQRLTAMENGG